MGWGACIWADPIKKLFLFDVHSEVVGAVADIRVTAALVLNDVVY